jgi:hypothetical protein
MTNREMIYYLNKTLHFTIEMQPLVKETTSRSNTNRSYLSELEIKQVQSKVYLEESIKQLEEWSENTLFLKGAVIFIGCLLVGIFIGFLLTHK